MHERTYGYNCMSLCIREWDFIEWLRALLNNVVHWDGSKYVLFSNFNFCSLYKNGTCRPSSSRQQQGQFAPGHTVPIAFLLLLPGNMIWIANERSPVTAVMGRVEWSCLKKHERWKLFSFSYSYFLWISFGYPSEFLKSVYDSNFDRNIFELSSIAYVFFEIVNIFSGYWT